VELNRRGSAELALVYQHNIMTNMFNIITILKVLDLVLFNTLALVFETLL